LHHIEKKYQKTVLSNLKKISKQLIIIDVDDPRNSSVKSRLWNNYYVYLLGDQGNSFLTFSEFEKALDFEKSVSIRLKTGAIDTIKGKYFYASASDQ